MRSNLNFLQVAVLLVSASYGIGFLFGSGELAVTTGLAGSLYGLATSAGLLAMTSFSGHIWRRRLQVWDLLAEVHGHSVRRLTAGLSVVWLSGVLAAQISGATVVLQLLLGLSQGSGLALAAAAIACVAMMPLGRASKIFGVLLLLSAAILAMSAYSFWSAAPQSLDMGRLQTDFSALPAIGLIGTVISVALLASTGSDYLQFVLEARSPIHAWLGCLFAALFLAAMSFLPPLVVMGALSAGAITSEPASAAIPAALSAEMNQFHTAAAPATLLILLTAALGSGGAVLRAIAAALCSVLGRGPISRVYLLLSLLPGLALASLGLGIIMTMVRVNAIYIGAVAILFVLALRRKSLPHPSAGIWMMSVATVAAAVVEFAYANHPWRDTAAILCGITSSMAIFMLAQVRAGFQERSSSNLNEREQT